MSEQKNQYFIYYYYNSSLVTVTHKTFKKVIGPTISFKKGLVKLVGVGTRHAAYTTLKGFMAEGLFESCGDFFSGLSLAVSLITQLGKAKRLTNQSASLLLTLVLFLHQVYGLKDNFDVPHIVNTILSLLQLYFVGKTFSAESLEAVTLAGISYLFPPIVSDFIKRIQTFTNAKICDDTSLFYSFLTTIIDFFLDFCDKLPGGDTVKNKLKEMLLWCKLSSSHLLLYQIENLLKDYNKVKQHPLTSSFIKQIKDLYSKSLLDKDLVEWSRRSSVVAQMLAQLKRIYTIALNSENVNRVEPSAYIFEGPPGCGKSLASCEIISALDMTCYTHCLKAVNDGKDFYDNYDNQEIFSLDDVGAQGDSQWRSLINWVSSVKMPLECAQAHLKDTKYFNSSIIIATTNRFMTISGLTKSDSIANVEALFRRGYVFDFSQTRNVGGSLRGELSFKHFDVKTNRWVEGIPPYLISKYSALKNIPATFHISPSADKIEWIAWACAVIKGIRKAKENFCESQGLSNEQRVSLASKISTYLPEGWLFSSVSEDDDLEEELEERPVSNFSWLDISAYNMILNTNFFKNWMKEVFFGFLEWLVQSLESVSQLCSGYFLTIASVVLIHGLIFYFTSKNDKVSTFVPENEPYVNGRSENLPHKLIKAIYDVAVTSDEGYQSMKAVVSGHHILLPYHSLIHCSKGSRNVAYRVTIFGDKDKNSILVDKELVTIGHADPEVDLVVLQLPSTFPTPFKNVCQFFQNDIAAKNPMLVNNKGAIRSGLNVRAARSASYTAYDWNSSFGSKDFEYDFRGAGLCGSVLVSQREDGSFGVIGMHVAGSSSDNVGVSKFWPQVTRNLVYHLLKNDCKNKIPFEPVAYRDDTSVMKLKADVEQISEEDFKKLQSSVPTHTKLIPTPLYGVYPVTRLPADLQRTGRCTIKDVAKKSFAPVVTVSEDELLFGAQVIDQFIAPFKAISDSEVIQGTGLLAPLNKDSSNGFGCLKLKSEYVDFDTGKCKDFFKEELNNIENQMLKGDYPWKAFLWTESLKDELRGVEKDGEPRSFRVGTIHSQFLTKKYLGNMVENIIVNKWFSGIMVGINPFTEWDKLYKELLPCNLFAADIKKWDGGMLPQVQRAVINCIAQKFNDPAKRFFIRTLLENMVHSLLIVQDDLFLTTHSLPSGHFLTAIFNSLVNRFYTAMWYYRTLKKANLKPTVQGCLKDVKDFVYGDDKIVGVLKHSNLLTARSCCEFFRSIGLDLTTSDKKQIDFDFQNIEDIDFLKRKFKYHHEIGRIMCPLDLRTLHSGLSFCDSSKIMDDVVQDKLHNFQRELYLHDNAQLLLDDFYSRMAQKDYPYLKLPLSYLKFLYSTPHEMDNFIESRYF